MSTTSSKPQAAIQWLWSHISAAVALVLIVVALIVGYSIGNSPTINTQSEHEHTPVNDTPTEYTCSMHPSVRLTDPDAKCPICFMALIPVENGSQNSTNPNQLTLSDSAVAMSRIETTKVTRFFPSAQVRLYGKLTYDETSVARISAYFPGRIDRLFVNYVGVSVQQGDHLAELYSPELLAAFEELRQAKKSHDQSTNASAFMRDTAQQIIDASREKLRLFGITQNQISQVESGEFNTDQLTIYAPIGGVVTKLAAREGDYLDTGDPIATVANLSRLWLDLEAYESQFPMLRWGLPITFTVEAHPGETFEGRISFIEPMVDERTRTAAVRVAVDNTDGRLKPGMFATAIARPKIAADGAIVSDELAGKWVSPMHPTIVKDEAGTCDVCGMNLVTAESLGIVGDPSTIQTPLVIPRSAVLFTGTRSIVYIQTPDRDVPTYEGREIHLGPLAGDLYTVQSGLNEGDHVVTHGAFRIDSAMQLQAKPSMMMPDGGRSNTGHNHGNTPTTMPPMEMNSTIPDSFVDHLSPIYAAYLDAQERLADDDLIGFNESAITLTAAIKSISKARLTGSYLSIWDQSSKELTLNMSMMNINDARQHFETMTQGIMNLEETFGHATDQNLHVAFCPMAFDFKGAKWIQRGTEINNPYFGDAMLRCGDIEQELKPVQSNDHKGHTND